MELGLGWFQVSGCRGFRTSEFGGLGALRSGELGGLIALMLQV